MKENRIALSTGFLLLWALCGSQILIAESRLLPRISSFDKELSFNGKRIILSSAKNVITDNESFLYATCSSQEETFKENRCNVTLETPAFDGGATYRDSCVLHLAVSNPKTESLTNLRLQPFGDDRALLSWLVKDHDWNSKYAVVRILVMSTCKYTDLVVPGDKLQAVAPNQNGLDVVIRNKTFCGSENCKLSYDEQGRKLSGPTQFLANVKFHKLVSLVPASRGPINKGQPQFYALATVPTEHRLSLLQVAQDGKGTELLTVADHVIIRLSNSYDMLSACWTSERTNVTCRQFDSRTNKKLGVVLEFIDEPGFEPVRWIQPHNFGSIETRGLLLVTGQTSREDDRKFTSFSVIRIHPDGRRERPLEVEGLDYKCTNIRNFHVDVSENDPEDELCIHFACERTDYGERGSKDSLKFGSRCIPRRHVTLAKRPFSVIN